MEQGNIITTSEYYELIQKNSQDKNFAGLVGCNLTNVQFKGKHIGGSRINLSKTILSGLDLSEFEFSSAILTEATLVFQDKSHLGNIYLEGAILKKATIIGFQPGRTYTSLRGIDLREAKISDISFEFADLVGANLSGLPLDGVNFSNANITGADLSNSSLRGANFGGANLQGANLKEANISGVRFQNHQIKDAIMPDGSKYEQET